MRTTPARASRAITLAALVSLTALATLPTVAAAQPRTPPRRPAGARPATGGLRPAITGVEEATIVAIGLQLFNEVKDAVRSIGRAVVYAKAKVDGPDSSDDPQIHFDDDQDRGLDWDLEANALAKRENNVDDGEEKPYTPGASHAAFADLAYKSVRGKWQPDAKYTDRNNRDKKTHFDGLALAEPDDDPAKPNERTSAASAAAFSADGTTVDFKYTAAAATTADGQLSVNEVKQAPIGDPPFDQEKVGVFLASSESFSFTNTVGGRVAIQPLFGETVDLFHSYIQQSSNQALLPMLRGYSGDVAQMKREGYEERVAGGPYALDEDPAALADLTIVGGALHFASAELVRGGRSDEELLREYLSSSAIQIVAPEHAQAGYTPRVLFRHLVTDGQPAPWTDDYDIPPAGHGPLFGVAFGVGGSIDEAVAMGVNTDGHFTRDLALADYDGQNPNIVFRFGSAHFHDEDAQAYQDFALADPTRVPEPATTATVGTGLLLLAVLVRRRRGASHALVPR